MNNLLKYGLQEELKFLKLLNTNINDKNILISKTTYQYCPVDFQITNLQNNTSMMIELKSRKCDISNYQSFFIGYTKLHNIRKEYKNTPVILVWVDIFKNIFYVFFHTNLLNSKIGIINNGKVFFINKSVCNNGMDNLINDIKRYF